MDYTNFLNELNSIITGINQKINQIKNQTFSDKIITLQEIYQCLEKLPVQMKDRYLEKIQDVFFEELNQLPQARPQ